MAARRGIRARTCPSFRLGRASLAWFGGTPHAPANVPTTRLVRPCGPSPGWRCPGESTSCPARGVVGVPLERYQRFTVSSASTETSDGQRLDCHAVVLDEYNRLVARDTGGESNLLMGMPIVENLHGCAGLSRRARYLYGGIFFALASDCLRCSFAYHIHVMAQREPELRVARSPHDMGSSMGG